MVKDLPTSAGDAGFLTQTLNWEDPLDEEMANHSSILASEIPWTEESGVTKSQTQLSRYEHYTYISTKGNVFIWSPAQMYNARDSIRISYIQVMIIQDMYIEHMRKSIKA